MDKINFTGGFQFKTPSERAWKGIEGVLPRHKIILPNYGEDKDIFIAVKRNYDPQIINYLRAHHIKFTLFPKINLKSQLDSYNMEEAYRIVGAQTEVISSTKDINEYLKSFVPKFKLPKYKWKKNDHIDKTLKFLGINAGDCEVFIEKGITVITDKNGKIIAKVSPNNQKGTNFVFLYPKNADESLQKFAIDMYGNKYMFPKLEYKDFRKNFMNAVKIDSDRTFPQKNKEKI